MALPASWRQVRYVIINQLPDHRYPVMANSGYVCLYYVQSPSVTPRWAPPTGWHPRSSPATASRWTATTAGATSGEWVDEFCDAPRRDSTLAKRQVARHHCHRAGGGSGSSLQGPPHEGALPDSKVSLVLHQFCDVSFVYVVQWDTDICINLVPANLMQISV